MSDPPRATDGPGDSAPWYRSGVWGLAVLGLAQLAVWGSIAGLSVRFALGRPAAERPIAAVMGLIVLAFVLYALSWHVAARTARRGRALGVVFVIALIARGVLLPTAPILEIDIYRYMWDGRVVAEGVSPFRFSPKQVTDAVAPTGDDRLDRLADLRDRTPEVATVLKRIHYAEIATVYPPVSQAVFAAAAVTTPEGWPVGTQLAAMKTWLVLCDVATIAAVAVLLIRLGRPPAECLAYAWCPLVLKETANSGHLDAIAVALTAWAAVAVLGNSSLFSPSRKASDHVRVNRSDALRLGLKYISLSALLLSLAIGAKLYPVVLLPLFAALWWRAGGMPGLLAGTLLCTVISAATLWPMLAPVLATPSEVAADLGDAPPAEAPLYFGDEAPDDAFEIAAATPAPPPEPEQGLTAFLSRWEMNDLVFTALRDQLVVSERYAAHHRPWAVVTPREFRERVSAALATLTDQPAHRAAFLVTRALTLAASGLVALGATSAILLRPTPLIFLRGAFLTLAAFVLLAPTVNPWYWTWALPFLPFARGRVWGVVSLAVMTYYGRLWLVEHGDGKTLAELLGYAPGAVPAWADHAYQGSQIFDHLVVWLEWGPLFVLLFAEFLWLDGRRIVRAVWMPPRSTDDPDDE